MAEQILVPLDFSDATDAVLATARRLANALDLPLMLIHVAQAEGDFIGYQVGPQYIRDHVAEELWDQHEALEKLQQHLAADGIEAVAMLVPGDPGRKLVEEIDRLGPELIVIGSHGHGALYHLLTGSVCQAVLQHAACPVVVVPIKGATP